MPNPFAKTKQRKQMHMVRTPPKTTKTKRYTGKCLQNHQSLLVDNVPALFKQLNKYFLRILIITLTSVKICSYGNHNCKFD